MTNLESLTYLNVTNNNLPSQDLSYFSNFTTLKKLYLGNTQERIERGIYNRFYGSLECLQELSDLEELGISNTDIDSGLECFLASKLKRIYCEVQKKDIGCKKIQRQLKEKLGRTSKYYDFAIWKKSQVGGQVSSSSSTKTSIYSSTSASLSPTSYQSLIRMSNEKLSSEISSGLGLVVIDNDFTFSPQNHSDIKELEKQISFLNNRIIELEIELENKKSLERENKELKVKLKKVESELLLNSIKNKLNEEDWELVESLLEAQIELLMNSESSSFAQKQLIRIKRSLIKKVTEEEIQTLLSKQKEINYLEKELANFHFQEEKLEANIEIFPN